MLGINNKHSILLKQNNKYSNKLNPIFNRHEYKKKNNVDILIKIVQNKKVIILFILYNMPWFDLLFIIY